MNGNDYGLVSIITPNYNCKRFIAETIESVLSQTYQNWEMLIQDDCSNDGSYEIALKYAERDPRIKVEKNKSNAGAAITRNNALKRATGRWVAFLDSDDLWHSQKLESQLEFMIKNEYSFSYHNYTEISEQNQPLGVLVTGPKKISKIGMYNYCWPGCLTVMYDQSIVGPIQIEDIKKNNDYAMWLEVIEKCPCFLFNSSRAKYRRRKGSISNHGYLNLIKWHYLLFRDVKHFNPISSLLLTFNNLFWGVYKKLIYIKRDSN